MAVPEQPPTRRRHPRNRIRRVLRRRRVLLLLGGLVVLAGLLAIGIDVYARYLPAVRALSRARDAISQAQALLRDDPQHLDHARLQQANSLLSTAATDLGPGSQIVQTGVLADIAEHLPYLGYEIDAVRALRATGADGARLGEDVVSLVDGILPSAAGPQVSTLTRLARAADQDAPTRTAVLADVRALSADYASIPSGGLLGPLDHARDLARREVPGIIAGAGPAMNLLAAVPSVIGHGKHTYLLLLSNSAEERPGGGLIGAVGAVTFRDGVLESRSFRVADFGDDLVKNIPAPRPLNVYLFKGKPWELSDANWSPDFPTAAAQAAVFYQRATGTVPDGVIELDPVALGAVLNVIGTAAVPPYPQVVSASNALLDITEIINQARPGDPGKAYLAPFGAAVLDRLMATPLNEYASLVPALSAATTAKHIVLYFTDAGLEQLVDGGGAGGELRTPLSDALLVTDANVGGTKSDLFVTRDYRLAATVGADGTVQDMLRLTYHNPIPTDPTLRGLERASAGHYRDYVQVWVPETAQLGALTVTLNGRTVSVSPESVTYEFGREAIAYFLDIPPDGSAVLSLSYSGPFADITVTPEFYALAWAKELNALPWPIAVTVTMPGGATRVWTTTLDADRQFSVPQ
jgi:hypothetical protein